MDEVDQLIHDICVFQERIDFYNRYRPTLIDEITKLKNRQRSAVERFKNNN